MQTKIKVIIKRPGEKVGRMTHIENTLERLQEAVSGPIEVINTHVQGTLIICNEDGKLRNCPKNFKYGFLLPDIVAGTVVVCGADGEEFADVPVTMKQWSIMLQCWGNDVE